MMDYADTPRQGDRDGRGNLSQRALVDFTEWFLKVCLDQVTFMSEPDDYTEYCWHCPTARCYFGRPALAPRPAGAACPPGS